MNIHFLTYMAVDGGSENGLRVFTALVTLLSFLFKIGFIVVFHLHVVKGSDHETQGTLASRTGGTMNQIGDDLLDNRTNKFNFEQHD